MLRWLTVICTIKIPHKKTTTLKEESVCGWILRFLWFWLESQKIIYAKYCNIGKPQKFIPAKYCNIGKSQKFFSNPIDIKITIERKFECQWVCLQSVVIIKRTTRKWHQSTLLMQSLPLQGFMFIKKQLLWWNIPL